ncbi:hypothetical protein HDU85_000789 [Gaertneriomyces sp. JEL0708]|nr:hypothetical protein HDU85_000789 [Gaertneriomyces sp. JEL0708]
MPATVRPTTLTSPLASLPVELILSITSYLSTDEYITLSHSSRILRKILLSSGTQWSFSADPCNDVKCSGSLIKFCQEGHDLDEFTYDSVTTQVVERDGLVFFNQVYRGPRLKGDRSAQCRMPIHVAPALETEKRRKHFAYFEITILSVSTKKLSLRIGLARDGYSTQHPVGSLPHSIGYTNHGEIALGWRDGDRIGFAPHWGEVGDVVGCGYRYDEKADRPRGSIFFTLNGHWIGNAPHKIDTTLRDYVDCWHAVVTASAPCELKVNMSTERFLYVEANESIHQNRSCTESQAKHRMFPNVVPPCTDPYPPPWISSSSSSILCFPFNPSSIVFPRSFISSKPIASLPLHHPIADIPTAFHYYELQILSIGNGPSSFLSHGLVTLPYSPFSHIGWNLHSIGYHTDDGKIFAGACRHGEEYDPLFLLGGPEEQYRRTSYQSIREGTVLGCGIAPETGTVFFTRDGEYLGVAGIVDLKNDYYVGVAATHKWTVEMQFTGDFCWANANVRVPVSTGSPLEIAAAAES